MGYHSVIAIVSVIIGVEFLIKDNHPINAFASESSSTTFHVLPIRSRRHQSSKQSTASLSTAAATINTQHEIVVVINGRQEGRFQQQSRKLEREQGRWKLARTSLQRPGNRRNDIAHGHLFLGNNLDNESHKEDEDNDGSPNKPKSDSNNEDAVLEENGSNCNKDNVTVVPQMAAPSIDTNGEQWDLRKLLGANDKKKKLKKKIYTEEEVSRQRMFRLNLPYNMGRAFNVAAWTFLLFGFVLNFFGYSYILDDNNRLTIGTLGQRAFRDEIVRSTKQQQKQMKEQKQREQLLIQQMQQQQQQQQQDQGQQE